MVTDRGNRIGTSVGELGLGLHVCGSVMRCELQSIQLCVLAILEEMLEKLDAPRTRIVPIS